LASDSVQIILVLEKGRAEVTGKTCLLEIIGLMIISVRIAHSQSDATQITKWQYGKTGVVSLTYDDGSINQFRIAVPIMDSFNFPATFFIITGEIPGSRYHGTFIGRPEKDTDEPSTATHGRCLARKGEDKLWYSIHHLSA
jgi:Polysaccharide deacetylase